MSIPTPPGHEPTAAAQMINGGTELLGEANKLPWWQFSKRRRMRADARAMKLAGAYASLGIRPRRDIF